MGPCLMNQAESGRWPQHWGSTATHCLPHTKLVLTHEFQGQPSALQSLTKRTKTARKESWGIDLQRIVGEGHIIIKLAVMDQRARPPSLSHSQPENTPASRWGIFIYTYMYMRTRTRIWVLTYSTRLPNSGLITCTVVTNTHQSTHSHLMHAFVTNALWLNAG